MTAPGLHVVSSASLRPESEKARTAVVEPNGIASRATRSGAEPVTVRVPLVGRGRDVRGDLVLKRLRQHPPRTFSRDLRQHVTNDHRRWHLTRRLRTLAHAAYSCPLSGRLVSLVGTKAPGYAALRFAAAVHNT